MAFLLTATGRSAAINEPEMQGNEAPVYTASEITEEEVTSAPQSYVELQDYIAPYSDGISLGADISENEMYIVTSTSNNPVHYVKKLPMKMLVSFLKNDWISRGYTISDYK